MRRLLDPSFQRMIKILEILMEKDGWATYASLSPLVEASERTIAKDVSLLRDNWGHLVQLEVSKKHGVRLINPINVSLRLIYTEFYNQSVLFHWVKELVFAPGRPIEYYEKTLFTSRSTLLRQLPRLNEFLASQNMDISCKDGRYYLTGVDEQLLRDFTASLFIQLYGQDLDNSRLAADSGIQPGEIRQWFLAFLKPRVSSEQYDWTAKDQVILSYQTLFYLISLVREDQGYPANGSVAAKGSMGSSDISAALRERFPSITSNHLTPVHDFVLKSYNGWESATEAEAVQSAIDLYLDELYRTLSVDLTEPARTTMWQIMQTVYFITKLRPYDSTCFYIGAHYFSRSVKRANPYVYETLVEHLDALSTRVGVNLTFRLSLIIYWTCLICPQITLLTKPVSALLIDDGGVLHAEFLARLMTEFSNGKLLNLRVQIAEPNSLKDHVLTDYDLLITTIPDFIAAHPRLVLVNDYPSVGNWQAIFEAIKH